MLLTLCNPSARTKIPKCASFVCYRRLNIILSNRSSSSDWRHKNSQSYLYLSFGSLLNDVSDIFSPTDHTWADKYYCPGNFLFLVVCCPFSITSRTNRRFCCYLVEDGSNYIIDSRTRLRSLLWRTETTHGREQYVRRSKTSQNNGIELSIESLEII